jgi:hypothetical protein
MVSKQTNKMAETTSGVATSKIGSTETTPTTSAPTYARRRHGGQ